MDRQMVADHVSVNGMPSVTSIADVTHIFHFERTGFWEDSPLLFVNRNGHHFRLIQQPQGDWLFAKTWNGMWETQSWQIEANLRRPDPVKVINLCGIGPQGRQGKPFETLCLLPKDATHRRKAVYRQHMMDVMFDTARDQFTLIRRDNNERGTFGGKLWDSKEAVDWAREVFSDVPLKISSAPATKGPITAVQAQALEENPLWGAF